jgi:phenylacetate-CoA ligase
MRELDLDSGTAPARVIDAWRDFAPDILQGYPSALRTLAHYCLETRRFLTPGPRLIFTDSELLLPDTRALLERAFGTAPLDVFGTLETDNIAFQCAAGSGYHVTTDCVVLEIVAGGRPVPAGAQGEIVVTALFNRTAPFIRYNLKDIGRLSPDPCPCGRPFPLLSIVTGRSNELAVLRDGQCCTPLGIFAKLNACAGSVRQYQLRQTDVGSFDFFFVPTAGFGAADTARIINALRATLGDSKIGLHAVDRIAPDPSGKGRLFVPLPDSGLVARRAAK